MPRLALWTGIILMVVLPGCHEPSPDGLLFFPQVGLGGLDGPTDYKITPFGVPLTLKVGERIRFDVQFFGGASETGYVVWTTSNADVVRWDKPDPACKQDRCAELAVVGRGDVVLEIAICPGLPGDGCAGETSRRTVSE